MRKGGVRRVWAGDYPCKRKRNIESPAEALLFLRGLLHEEIAELHLANAISFAKKAYEELAQNDWFQKVEPLRLERLRQIEMWNPTE